MKISFQTRRWLYLTTAVLFVTGVVWMIWHDVLLTSSPFGPEISPVEPWSLKVHGAAAMVFLVVLGVLLPTHMKTSWLAKRNQMTGVTVIGSCMTLIVSGYGLYYYGGERGRELISIIHQAIGVLLPLMLVVHVLKGKKTRNRKSPYQ